VGVIDNRPHILDSAHVGDCMRAGIFTCDPHASLRELAATMASLRIHALALRTAPGQPPPFITDLELMAGMRSLMSFTPATSFPPAQPRRRSPTPEKE
jgi:hypothetical protein